jgi:hypothetical protein
MKTERRSALKKCFASVLGLARSRYGSKAARSTGDEKEADNNYNSKNVPRFFGSYKIWKSLYLLPAKGAHVEPFTIKAHTEIVLKELENELN